MKRDNGEGFSVVIELKSSPNWFWGTVTPPRLCFTRGVIRPLRRQFHVGEGWNDMRISFGSMITSDTQSTFVVPFLYP